MSERVHDEYGKQVLRTAAGPLCRTDGPSVVTDYGASSAYIDGTVGPAVAVEVESRTGKQVRGAVLDLILHAYPKKLLILIPKYIGRHQQSECEFILSRFIDRENFRVVLLEGSGHSANLEPDAARVKQALTELGCFPK